jgi:carboxymethylenebutenolidase
MIPAGNGAPSVPAFAVVPRAPRRGVVIIHEIFGRQPEIDRVAFRFADRGYAALSLDLFHRGRAACLVDVFRSMRTGDGVAVRQGKNARAWLCAETGLDVASVGLIGFCFGGGYALAAGSGWAAVSTNYGPIPRSEAMAGIGAVIGCYGADDRAFAKHGERLRRALAPVKVEPEVHVFEDAGHSFLTDGHHPVAAAFMAPVARLGGSDASRESGWKAIFAFFERHLTESGP